MESGDFQAAAGEPAFGGDFLVIAALEDRAAVPPKERGKGVQLVQALDRSPPGVWDAVSRGAAPEGSEAKMAASFQSSDRVYSSCARGRRAFAEAPIPTKTYSPPYRNTARSPKLTAPP